MTSDMSNTEWKILGGGVFDPAPFLIAGIINATPDSFYDGGRYDSVDAAIEHGREMATSGAHILDVGGESTRPYADPVSLEEELARVVPIIKGLSGLKSDFDDESSSYPVVSVDTYKAEVAKRALESGASIVNDVSACKFDPALAEVLSEYKPGYVLMHSLGRPEKMQDDPRYDDVVSEILLFFEKEMKKLTDAGLPESRIVLDPGIGFGKLLEHNLQILKNVEQFMKLGRPLFLGLSNKSLWSGLMGLAVGERGNATQAATALMASKGVRIHRVHDVELTRQTLTVATNLI